MTASDTIALIKRKMRSSNAPSGSPAHPSPLTLLAISLMNQAEDFTWREAECRANRNCSETGVRDPEHDRDLPKNNPRQLVFKEFGRMSQARSCQELWTSYFHPATILQP